jgi:hypothetical protein
LTRIEAHSFPSNFSRITIPSTVLFVAHDASWDPSRLSLSDEDSCVECGLWRRVMEAGTPVDFRRIVRGGACARAPLPLDLTGFEEGSEIGEASGLYRRDKDGVQIVVKAFDVSQFEGLEVERAIENLSNLRHPLIAALIGFAFSEGEEELKIGRLYGAGGSLADVVSSNPAWWTPTPTAKAKAIPVVGIALALRFSHGFGLLHGGLKASNILFDGGGRIQIADFNPMRRGGAFSAEGEGEGEEWSPQADVSAFVMLLVEIVAEPPSPLPSGAKAERDGEMILSPGIPVFVSEIIEGGVCPLAEKRLSFIDIFESLKVNDFQIVAGVNSEEVSAFVSRVESEAQSGDLE